jgi:hypothetical protein
MSKNGRNKNMQTYDYDDYEDDSKTKKQDKRRPVRNWKKVWSEHVDDYDEIDDFHTR